MSSIAKMVAASNGTAAITKPLSFPSYLSMTIREQGAMSLYSGKIRENYIAFYIKVIICYELF